MAKRKAPASPAAFEPYALRDPAGVVGGAFNRPIVCAPTFCGVRVVERVCLPQSMLGVRDRIIMDHQLPNYPRLDPKEFPLHSLLDELKSQMLTHGATPESVVLVGSLSPFSEEELRIMAEKLKTKSAGKKPAAADKKADAAKEPRASRSSLDTTAAIAVTDKGKAKIDKAGKDDKLAQIVAAKKVGKALEIDGVSTKDIHYAARVGLITVG